MIQLHTGRELKQLLKDIKLKDKKKYAFYFAEVDYFWKELKALIEYYKDKIK